MYSHRKFAIVATYDTETTNIGEGVDTRAFPILFIDNDLRGIDLYDYVSPRDDSVHLYRTESEYISRLEEYIKYGVADGRVPVICAYNLMFDLQPLMATLDAEFDIRVNAQTSTNVYTLDLYERDGDQLLLRFWDTFFLELGGLAAMGRTAGLPKMVGAWDYDLVRTPDTPLTTEEEGYARRDVQVIPAYLSYLLHANHWMRQSDLGVRVLTKTSVVRRMARHEIANLEVKKENGKRLTVDKAFLNMCRVELPVEYGQYALRKECFIGGLTFTAARTCCKVVSNVYSLDVTSMHHTFINGRYLPERFRVVSRDSLRIAWNRVMNVSVGDVLRSYHKPFPVGFHMRVRLRNVRLCEGSPYAWWGIGLIPQSKFRGITPYDDDVDDSERNVEAENGIKSNGWMHTYRNPTFCLGKLMEADEVTVGVSEVEAYCMRLVYEWDSEVFLCGEVTTSFTRPPDYVTLQSNMLFDMKTQVKEIVSNYRRGTPYAGATDKVPEGIALQLRAGSLSEQFLSSWYTSTVKGMFNGIYGTNAQDIFKPSYKEERGELMIDDDTRANEDNFDPEQKKAVRVEYNYGLRIVGGSRLHLVLAIELLWEAFGSRIDISGGDTDSLKVATYDTGVGARELSDALRPLAEASDAAIARCMERVRESFSEVASPLTGVGHFEVENADAPYERHIEWWNKARASYDGERFHVTMAGVPRPENEANVEDMLNTAHECGMLVDWCLTELLGYNCTLDNSVCHTLGHHKPLARDLYDDDVTDHNGDTRHVTAHQSIALYPTSRTIGALDTSTAITTLAYIAERYGTRPNTEQRVLGHDDEGYYVGDFSGITRRI